MVRGTGIADLPVSKSGLPLQEGDLSLRGIQRLSETLQPPLEDVVVRSNDVLLFLGTAGALSSLWDILPPATDQMALLRKRVASSKRSIMEASVAPHSPVVGQNGKIPFQVYSQRLLIVLLVLETAFVENYQAAIVGIHRHGVPAEGMIGKLCQQLEHMREFSPANRFDNNQSRRHAPVGRASVVCSKIQKFRRVRSGYGAGRDHGIPPSQYSEDDSRYISRHSDGGNFDL